MFQFALHATKATTIYFELGVFYPTLINELDKIEFVVQGGSAVCFHVRFENPYFPKTFCSIFQALPDTCSKDPVSKIVLF